MARPPKSKAPEAAAPIAPTPAAVYPGAPKVIDVENYIRVRDSVYARLSTIQDLLKSFAIDYLRQTNLLLGEGTNLDNADLAAFSIENVLPLMVAPAAAPAVAAAEEDKKRKKRAHDPNAPKRPLTPYFLYMQTARPIIAQDLGADAPKGAVQDEGQRRWGTMAPAEKQGWNQAYQYNLRLYNARTHSYKAGNPDARAMTDEEAAKYAEEMHIPMPTVAGLEEAAAGNDQDAIAEQLNLSAVAAAETPAKTPRPKKAAAAKRKSTSAATPVPAATEVEPPKSAAMATPASPDAKKRKRASTKPAEEKEEPKKSARKKAKN